jgi:hypothetical protein
MCICVWLGEAKYTEPTSNKDLNELLQEVREATGDDWRLQEKIRKIRRHWFKGERTVSVYSLYNHLHSIEFQVINFYCEEDDYSIHTMCSADVMAAYLTGILTGLQCRK